jgi:antitoxin CcdA
MRIHYAHSGETNPMAVPNRRPTNMTLDATLVEQARALDLNLSRAAEAGLADAIRREKEQRWLKENAKAIEGYNRYIEEHGLPLEKLRPW